MVGGLSEYQQEFQRRSQQSGGMASKVLVGVFFGGLKQDCLCHTNVQAQDPSYIVVGEIMDRGRFIF